MTNEEFATYAIEHLTEYLSPGATADVALVGLAPDGQEQGFLLGRQGTSASQIVPLHVCNEAMTAGATPGEALRQMTALSRRETNSILGLSIHLEEFDAVRTNLTMAVCDPVEQADFLQDKPWRRLGSLAVYYQLRFDTRNERTVMITVSNSLMEAWGQSETTLHILAAFNGRLSDPAWLELPGVDGDTPPNLLDAPPAGPQRELLRLTNRSHFLGAGVIGWPGVPEGVARIVGGDYLVIPFSVHSLLVLPLDGDLDVAAWETGLHLLRSCADQVPSTHLYMYEHRSSSLAAI